MKVDKDMRILFTTTGYKPAYRIGGPIISVSAVAENLVRRGHEVVVFTSNSNLTEDLDVPLNEPVDVDGVQVWYFQRQEIIKKIFPYIPYLSQSSGFIYSPLMRRELERQASSFDVIHTQCPFIYPTYAAAKAAVRFNKPLFYQQRGAFGANHLKYRAFKKKLYIAAIERKILRNATTLIALTQAEIESYRTVEVNTPCAIVPNGVDVEKYRQQSDGSTNQLLNLPENVQVLLFLGRFNQIKGADALLEAFKRIHKYHPNTFLVMAGPDERNLENSFKEIAKRFGFADRVVFPGMVSGNVKLDLLARADLFCLPSHAEGFSMTILEALASATPALISPDCNFPEVETAGVGRIVAASPDQLTDALSDMLSQPEMLRDMGSRAHDFVARNYSWDKIVDHLLEVYQEGIQRHRIDCSASASVPTTSPKQKLK